MLLSPTEGDSRLQQTAVHNSRPQSPIEDYNLQHTLDIFNYRVLKEYQKIAKSYGSKSKCKTENKPKSSSNNNLNTGRRLEHKSNLCSSTCTRAACNISCDSVREGLPPAVNQVSAAYQRKWRKNMARGKQSTQVQVWSTAASAPTAAIRSS